MKVVNYIECESAFKRDGNTKYIPKICISGKTKIIYSEKSQVLIKIDSGKEVSVNGYSLINSIKNAMNT